jgi:hypothetical protein
MVPWPFAPLVLIFVLLVMPTLTPAANRWKLAGGGIFPQSSVIGSILGTPTAHQIAPNAATAAVSTKALP